MELFDDYLYIFYNISLETPTKVKLTKEELDELKRHNSKENTRFEPLGFKPGALGCDEIN